MASAEKRGKFWRARWFSQSGKRESMPGFTTKKAAEDYADDRAAEIRAGRYIDPRAGLITLTEWVNAWFPSLDLEPSTLENYRYFLEVHVLPVFGDRPIAAITPENVATWEKSLVHQSGYAPRTAKDARTTLATCLSDAVPSRIPTNPAIRKKAKGRRGIRRIEKAQEKQKVWASPLGALLFAERIAALSGRDVDLIPPLLFAYTGARWSEVLALGTHSLQTGSLDLHQKLYELKGRFYLGAPKDGSIRTLDIPDFLSDLLELVTPQRCTCKLRERVPGEPPWCVGGEYLFLGPGGGHHRRSNYGRRLVRPAADGWHPATKDKGGRSAVPVLADASQGWPGAPLPPWPTAVKGQPFEPPRKRGLKAVPESAHLVSWLPIMVGLTPHSLRHGHQTWMAEDRIADVLRDERMGHVVQDEDRIASLMRDHYTHVSEQMRTELIQSLERRWKQSLAERAALERLWHQQTGVTVRSPVALMNDLLKPYRDEEIENLATINSASVPKLVARRARRSISRSAPSLPQNQTFQITEEAAP
jgi:integrase